MLQDKRQFLNKSHCLAPVESASKKQFLDSEALIATYLPTPIDISTFYTMNCGYFFGQQIVSAWYMFFFKLAQSPIIWPTRVGNVHCLSCLLNSNLTPPPPPIHVVAWGEVGEEQCLRSLLCIGCLWASFF